MEGYVKKAMLKCIKYSDMQTLALCIVFKFSVLMF